MTVDTKAPRICPASIRPDWARSDAYLPEVASADEPAE